HLPLPVPGGPLTAEGRISPGRNPALAGVGGGRLTAGRGCLATGVFATASPPPSTAGSLPGGMALPGRIPALAQMGGGASAPRRRPTAAPLLSRAPTPSRALTPGGPSPPPPPRAGSLPGGILLSAGVGEGSGRGGGRRK